MKHLHRLLALLLALGMLLTLAACAGETAEVTDPADTSEPTEETTEPGELSFDEWDSYVANLEQMGIQDAIDVQQDALDRYFSR